MNPLSAPLFQNAVAVTQPGDLPAQTEGLIRTILNSGGSAAAKLAELQAQIQTLPPDQRDALLARLADENDDLSQLVDSQLSAGNRQDLLVETPPHGDPVTLNSNPDGANPLSPSGRSLAARGEGPVSETDTQTIDQWNYYRAHGNPPDLPSIDPISARQTDAMIAARGGDRSTPITAKEYLALLEKTKEPPPEPDTIHARAARGDTGSIGLDDSTTFNIDQWAYYRTSGNPPEVPEQAPMSGEQVEAMIAANGGDRSKPITVKEFLDLVAKTNPPVAAVPIEDLMQAAALRRDY